MPQVRIERQDGILVATLDNPPVNALGHALRQAIADMLAEAARDPDVRGIAILAAGRTFPAGADIAEFGMPPRAPTLPDLCDMVEGCAKPVVAGLHGTVLGGGLELALAAHHRVARADARMGFPEVGLGILPGAGGTQRAPRVAGARAALEMMLSGRPIVAAEAEALGLVDLVVAEGLRDAAIALAATAAVRPTRARTEGLRDHAANVAAVAAARARVRDEPLPGPGRIVDCVEAALLLPFEQGAAFERAAFVDLVASPEAAALRHLFFAQRRAGRVAGGRDDPVRAVAVRGTGADAVALCLDLLRAGTDVTLVGASHERLEPALAAIAGALDAEVQAGTATDAARTARWAQLTPALDVAGGKAVDLLIGTSGEGEDSAPAGPLVVTLGGGARAGLVLGPPGGVAEVTLGPGTPPGDAAMLIALVRRTGRVVVTGTDPGHRPRHRGRPRPGDAGGPAPCRRAGRWRRARRPAALGDGRAGACPPRRAGRACAAGSGGDGERRPAASGRGSGGTALGHRPRRGAEPAPAAPDRRTDALGTPARPPRPARGSAPLGRRGAGDLDAGPAPRRADRGGRDAADARRRMRTGRRA